MPVQGPCSPVSSDVTDAIRQRYKREVLELELTMQRCKREARENVEELARVLQELKEEWQAGGRLRAMVASQLTTFVGLNAQVAALQKENAALRELEPRIGEGEGGGGEAFDRVFEPTITQAEVFEEISLLAQSYVDGQNVCIFAYGQTGSGKLYTVEGSSSPEDQGMIPWAVDKVFQAADELPSKGWEYTMEGQFLEIYNEPINALFVSFQNQPSKLEIKHDSKTSSTQVTNLTVLPLL